MSMYGTRPQVSDRGNVEVVMGDSPDKDAFSRLRVSNPVTIFDVTFNYDLQPLVFEAVTANGGTVAHLPNESSFNLTLDGTSDGVATMQRRSGDGTFRSKS